MDFESIKNTFSNRNLVEEYKQAATEVGLWQSEAKLVEEYFNSEDKLLIIGAGAGRVAFGLWSNGYKNIHAIDISQEMAEAFHEINRNQHTSINFQVANAIDLPFAEDSFDGIIMPYNVLMHIPKHANRLQALIEARRVLTKGGKLIFSTHDDRDASLKFKEFWKVEKLQWDNGNHDKCKEDFGDVIVFDKTAFIYLHIPKANDVLATLNVAGFYLLKSANRSAIAVENEAVMKFSMECRFWVAAAV